MVIAAPPPAHTPPAHVATLRPAVADPGWTAYVVRDGDTLSGIAARFRTSPGALSVRNRLGDPDVIRPGQRLSVPRPAATPRAAVVPARVYVVRSGDTLSGIATRHDLTLANLLKANRLSPRALIHPGQRLTVRTGTARAAARKPAPAAARTYLVRDGDTLSGIARAHGTTAGALARASGIDAGALLRVGQRLRLPGNAVTEVPDSFAGRTYPRAVALAAARNRAALAERSVPTRSEVRRLVAATARRHGVDPALALAISYQESGWNQRAVSPANAVGVMQVIPQSGRWASELVGRRLDLLDTEDNVTAGVVILRALGRASGDTRITVAAYYQGLEGVTRNGMYPDTRQYVANVLRLRRDM